MNSTSEKEAISSFWNESHIGSKKFVKCNSKKMKKILIKEGFTQQINKNYYKKGSIYTHYNKYMKKWVFETNGKVE